MSRFAEWFKAQHGERESPQFAATDDNVLRVMIEGGQSARDELRRRQEWDGKHTSALWAWQARVSERQDS